MANLHKSRIRSRHGGGFLIESPVTIWVLFVVFLIPFIDMAAVLIRYTFVVTTARDAVHAAARARSFLSDTNSTDRSAVNLATATAHTTANSFSEITLDEVQTRIVITDVSTREVSYRTEPLPEPADTQANVYEVETIVAARINPLVTFNTGFLPGIPGLSAPIPVTVAAREFFESPQGLTN